MTGLDLNPGMLTVARSVPPAPGASIEWREGDAAPMPFPDGAFEVVLCQLGLQYFTDRSKALREMHRVLAPGGRLALMVWRSIRYSPGFAVLADALERHVSPEAAKVTHAPFSLGDTEELRCLMTGAGSATWSSASASGPYASPVPTSSFDSTWPGHPWRATSPR